ncbi:Putative cytochrome P450 [Septoria linicola]|uniref:Cytochrome P450 n=1 Tax=Septoria linicola TaxID=215465 RepID=A0A9Q9AVI5_9PEZI|nr:Putative cytochrome P450 [Septoria linicola]
MALLEGIVETWQHTSTFQRLLYSLSLIAFTVWAQQLFKSTKSSVYPFANTKKSDFTKNARRLLIEGGQKFTGPFKVLTDSGPTIMLPPEHIDAINATDQLSFNAHVAHEFMAHFETFRVMRPPPPGMFGEAVIKGITRALPKYTKPLSQEMIAALDDTWGDQQTWKQVKLAGDVQGWVSRISTCIFLGPDFAHNKDWNGIMTSYTVNLFMAIGVTKVFHPAIRPVIDLISPLNRKCRRDHTRAAAILKPVLEAREKEINAAEKEDRSPELPDDSIEWFRNAAHGRAYQDTDLQLALAIAAIHTSSDLLCQAILNFCAHSDIQTPLRQEAVDVLKKYGLQKVALTELRLLDSFFKETQRLKPINMASMHRSAMSDVTLPGTDINIFKGEQTAISSERMWNPEIYAEPEKFDAYRYIEKRKIPGWENKGLLVSTSPEHLGFAHGKHACPGRFFAANEVKIAMLHVMLNYDMKIDRPEDAQCETYGTAMFVRRGVKIWMRKREAEVDLTALANEL